MLYLNKNWKLSYAFNRLILYRKSALTKSQLTIHKHVAIHCGTHSESIKIKNTMTKKIIGFAFLIIASFLIIYFMYRILKNPNSLLIFKTLSSGELGLKWTLGIFLFHSFFFVIIFLLFKFGIKWTKSLQWTELKN